MLKELIEIFLVFTKVGLFIFGGGYSMLPIIQKDLVENRQWVTEEEVLDYYALSQCIPGVIAVNTAMFIGNKRKGKPGLICAALGMIFPSIVIIIIVAMFFNAFMKYEVVKQAFNGIRIAVSVLIVNATLKLWKTAVIDKWGIIIFIVTFLLLILVNISPILPVVAASVAGILLLRKQNKLKT